MQYTYLDDTNSHVLYVCVLHIIEIAHTHTCKYLHKNLANVNNQHSDSSEDLVLSTLPCLKLFLIAPFALVLWECETLRFCILLS